VVTAKEEQLVNSRAPDIAIYFRTYLCAALAFIFLMKKKKLIHPVHSLKLHLSVMTIVCDYSRAMLSAPGELTSYSGKGRKMQLKWGPEGSKL